MICEQLKKEAKVLQKLGEQHKAEFGLCIKDNNVMFVKGSQRSVRIPTQCNIVLHNHPLSPIFSKQDLKESEKAVVCLVHKNILKCAKNRTIICETKLEEIPKMNLSFDHHDARFNLLEIAKQLALLEEHYSREEMRCGDCMVKHLLLIQGYAEEGLKLEHGEEYAEIFREAIKIVNEHKKMLEEETLKESAVEELRELRKKIFQALNVFELEESGERTWQGLPVKYDRWDWDLIKPKLPSQRWEIKEKYGEKCFLKPAELGFPICNIYGQLDCDGLRAAYVRARALITASQKVGREDLAKEYEAIAEKALTIAREVGCGWVAK
ncbi:MAG: hypothetical protein QXO15_05240 [Nitrososphaerota archaeon]